MTELLKGAPVAAEIDARTVELISSSAVTPCLAVLRIGERPDVLSYERSAIKKAAKVGIALKSVVLPSSASQRELMEAITALNCDDSVHGILMFRPLPGGFDEDEAVMTLSPAKDVDGITPGSMARVYSGSGEGFPPCTAQSVIEILDYYGIDEITEDDQGRIKQDYIQARRAWIAEIRKDAEKEFRMGDVEQSVLDNFVSNLDHEVDYEN